MNVELILEQAVSHLKQVPGVEAIVLGGSRARGTHTDHSDIDIGIYYNGDNPLDTKKLSEAAAVLDDLKRSDVITPIGEWGPWINGGGWLQVGGIPVDFLYREIGKVEAAIDDCRQGRIHIDYQPGHPHGFVNSIYAGEVAVCRPLWDPKGIVAELKAKTQPVSPAYKEAVIGKFLWEADFSAANAEKGISRLDVSYAAGHLFRAVSCLTQVLFAVNEEYLLNEKGAAAYISRLSASPENFETRVREAFARLVPEQGAMEEAIRLVGALIQDARALVQGMK